MTSPLLHSFEVHLMTTHVSPGTTQLKSLRALILTVGAAAGLTLQTDVMARPGYANNLKLFCAAAKRPAPFIAADECSTCHGSLPGTRTAKTDAYLSRNLDVFCPFKAANAAPVLVLSPSGVIAASVGQTVQLSASATDPDKNPVVLAARGLPDGAEFNPASGVFSWTPLTSGTYTFTLQATDRPADTSQAKTVEQTVVVRVSDATETNTPPQLDPIRSPQSVSILDTLSFRVSAVDMEGDQLVLSASPLPAGARFDFLGLVDGKWTGEFVWQAAAAQVGKRFTTQFSVREVATSPILQDSRAVEFQVMMPTVDAAIKQVIVDQANYRNGRLRVSGRIKLKAGSTMPVGLSITVADANGTAYGQAKPTGAGTWTLNVPVATNSVPCRIQATVNGIVSVSQPVQPLPSGCKNKTRLMAERGDDDGDDDDDDDAHDRD